MVNPIDLIRHIAVKQGIANKADFTFRQLDYAVYTVVVYLVEKPTVAQLVDKGCNGGFTDMEAVSIRGASQSDVLIVSECLRTRRGYEFSRSVYTASQCLASTKPDSISPRPWWRNE